MIRFEPVAQLQHSMKKGGKAFACRSACGKTRRAEGCTFEVVQDSSCAMCLHVLGT